MLRATKVTEKVTAIGPEVYTALFSDGWSPPNSFETKDWEVFLAKNNEYTSPQGLHDLTYCLESISAYVDDSSTVWFTGVWNFSTEGSTVGRYDNWNSFAAQFESVKSSQRFLGFDIYASGGHRFYIGTWGSTPITQRFIHDFGLEEFTTFLKVLSDENWRLTRIRLYPDGARKTWHATGLFEQDGKKDVPPGRYDLVFKNDWASFDEQYQKYQVPLQNGLRMRLEDFEVFDDYRAGKRYYVGIYRERSGANAALFNEDWGTIVNQSNNLWKGNGQLKKIIRYGNQIHMPTPNWSNSFKTRLADKCVGYCGWQFHGNIEAYWPFGLARAKQDWSTPSADQTKPPQAFKIDTRFNLGSVSKPVTGLAAMRLVYQKKITSIDDPFYGYAVIDCVAGKGGESATPYAQYVSDDILKTFGIDTRIFNPVPDPIESRVLYYADPPNTQKGITFDQMTGVAAAGWISSAKQLSKFVVGAYNGTVLGDKELTETMSANQLGWDTWEGLYGQYFSHGGAFGGRGSKDVPYGLSTCIMIFPGRQAALLLINHCVDGWTTDAPTELVREYEAQAASEKFGPKFERTHETVWAGGGNACECQYTQRRILTSPKSISICRPELPAI